MFESAVDDWFRSKKSAGGRDSGKRFSLPAASDSSMGSPWVEGSTETIEYEPTSVKDLLVEMKDTAELLIDLAYSAVLQDSDTLAVGVLELEDEMNILQIRAWMSLLMAARNPSEAESLAPVLGIVAAATKISDAAADIAKVVLEDIGLPDSMRAGIPEAGEVLARGTVIADSDYAGRTLRDIDLESKTGVRAIAVRRDSDWQLNPGPETRIHDGQTVILRGPDQTLGDVYRTMTGESYEHPDVPEPEIPDLERAVDSIVLMKDLSELSVDLAYGSVLFNNAELAEEVQNIEVEVDALQSRLEAWTLRAAADAEDPISLRGLIHLAISTEVISDAAVQISDGVRREADVHPVVAMAVQESDEIIVRVTVDEGSELVGERIEEGVPIADVGMTVIAIRRPDEGWLLVPTTNIDPGDVLIAKGTRTAAESFSSLGKQGDD